METTEEKLWNSNYLKVWTANFLIFFSFMLLAPLLPLYLSETFAADRQTIGLVLSGYTITALLIRPLSGYLADSFERKQVLLVCYSLFAVFFVGYLVAGTLLLFTIVRTLHGAPFGATTVANSTVAIDTLPSSRRAEGIGYYGLSNNIAAAIAPTFALLLLKQTRSYQLIFTLATLTAFAGVVINSRLELKPRPLVEHKQMFSLDRFFLTRAWCESGVIASMSFAYGVVSTYVAIYGKEELDITGGTGVFFLLLAGGLILSRLVGGRSLGKGHIGRNAAMGLLLSLGGYLLFAALHNPVGYYGAALVVGLGNGHAYPALQNMFINLASSHQRGTANSSLLISWDVGMGLGVLAGGALAQHWGYHSAFWAAWAVNLLGVLFFFAYVRAHFERRRLQ
ncbi:MAG: MFS transporter [Paludibacteraceae bacterium]|nr:MFS transporter [Paludibacteraceae bacterium]